MKLLISLLVFACVHQIIDGTVTKFGPYCIAIKAHVPFSVTEKELVDKGITPNITYKVEISAARQECDRRLFATYHVLRRIETLGMSIKVERYSDGHKHNAGKANEIRVPNLCKTEFSSKPFFDRFNATFDDTCSLEPGIYVLKNWSLYDHMKDAFPSMQIASYIVHTCWLENNEDCVMESVITMDFKDASSREAAEKMASNGGIKAAKQRRLKKKDKDEKDEKDEDSDAFKKYWKRRK